MTHPFGVDTVTVTPDNIAKNQGLGFTEDILPVNGVFTGTLGGRVGPFLRKATGLVTSPDGNVYVGDSIALVTVTGTPVTSFTVAGPISGTTNLFTLEGKVIGMSITPTTIAFPAQRPAPFISTPIPVTVANLSSTSTLTIATITALGANAADFQVADVSCLTGPVVAGGTCTFNVIFSGAAAGPVARTASVEVAATLGTVPKVAVTPITGIIDAVPPTVLSTFPTTTSAPANVNITVKFSESMDPATINATTFTMSAAGIGPITGTPVYNDANKIASIALPAAQEQALIGKAITAQVTTGMTDVVGNALASAVTISFTASEPDRVPPTLAVFDPPNNATGVETAKPISVTFSEPMLSTSITGSVMQVTSGGVPVDGTVTVAGNVATFTPARPLAFGTAFTVTITTGAQDLASNALAAGQVINFVTNFAPAAPEIVSPANGVATTVARPVVLRWKPSVDQDGDTISYHLFYCNNQAFIGTAPNCVQDVKITPATAQAKGIYYASVASGGMLFTLFGLSFAAGIKGRKKILLMIAVLVIAGLFIISCSKSSDSGPPPSTDLTFQIEGLNQNATYFWKLEADDGKGGVTATPVMTFTTQ
jgi:hypothetical protein